MSSERLNPLHGVILDREVQPRWELLGLLDEKLTFSRAVGAAGLYAFVLENGLPLYLGKAGGIKPGEQDKWANDISIRLAEHWSTGPFRGLVRATNARIQVWVMDLRKVLDRIWERDVERIENDLIAWLLQENERNLPGNTSYEGTSSRRFVVYIQRVGSEALPRVTLKPGTSPETRKTRKPV